jgi:NTP pyrophosphatase (non-canonical NTP hydrolase)
MTLEEYQQEAIKTDKYTGSTSKEDALVIPVLGLLGEAGTMAAEIKKKKRDGKAYTLYADQLKEELGDILWYVSNIASKLDCSLDDIAKANLAKTQERWPLEGEKCDIRADDHLLDDPYPTTEQFPRSMEIHFTNDEDGRTQMMWNGNRLGNSLSDNSYQEDGYRFHDAFHLGFMAKLGWSPVMRKLLERKRRSVHEIDEIEDGARAIILEEIVAHIVFENALFHQLYAGVEEIDFQLLQMIKQLVRRVEVKDAAFSEWRDAILDSYSVFRKLNENDGGWVILDLKKREIIFRKNEDGTLN